jgi:ABC-type branched-subunit amino acid transport system ATPase component
VTNEERLDGVRRLLVGVPVDDVPSRHAHDLDVVERRRLLLELLVAHEPELLGVDEHRR